MTASDTDHPDAWGAGLRVRLKTLSTKTVSRATEPGEVLGICLAHNLRAANADHRHRSRIDPSRTRHNEVLRGPSCPLAGAELAQNIFDELGVAPARRDAIVGIEAVFQPPEGGDTPAFWAECLNWVCGRYRHVLSAVIHRDQARAHAHIVALAVVDGRLAGNELTAGLNRFTAQRADFMRHMRDRLGLRPDRRVKTLAELALSAGRGPKTRAAAARRDAKLTRHVGVGMGVDGHGGSSPQKGNPHAQKKSEPPLLRSVSIPQHIRDLWVQVAAILPSKPASMTPCPKPPGHAQNTAERLERLAVLFAECRAPMSPCPAPVN